MELHNLSAEEQYSLLIQFRKDHPLDSDVYGEVHHIQPRSCGGTDDQENLVKLLPEEHYKVHALLPEVMRERNDLKGYKSMLLAWNIMRNRQKSLDEEAAEYARLKKQFSESRMGHEVSEETRKKISEKVSAALKGRPHTAEHNRKVSQAKMGKHLSDAHKKAISEAHLRGHYTHSEEWKRANSARNKGKKWDADFCRKVSEAKKLYWAKKRAEKQEKTA